MRLDAPGDRKLAAALKRKKTLAKKKALKRKQDRAARMTFEEAQRLGFVEVTETVSRVDPLPKIVDLGEGWCADFRKLEEVRMVWAGYTEPEIATLAEYTVATKGWAKGCEPEDVRKAWEASGERLFRFKKV